MNNCEHCGAPITKTRRGVRYCDKTCMMRAYHERRKAEGRSLNRTMHERTCIQCGKRWATVKATAQYCSNACIVAARFGPDRKPRPLPMTPRVRKARAALRKAQRGSQSKGIVWTQGACGWCREQFLSRTSAGTPARYCTKKCQHRAIKHRHLHRKRAAYVADVSPKAIYERDAYRCHICKRKIDKRKVVPHPKAPTLDHLVPLSLGGTHEPANVATACFLCNSTKSNLRAGDQLALIG